MTSSRYAHYEHERRFLVPPGEPFRDAIDTTTYRIVEDKYLPDTRLRLRRLTRVPTGERAHKLTRKEEPESPFSLRMTTLYITEHEHKQLDSLEGHRLRKARYNHLYLGHVFAIDVFEGPLDGLVLCSVEADTFEALMAVPFPPFALRDVTADPFFTGGNLCRITAEDLRRKLADHA